MHDYRVRDLDTLRERMKASKRVVPHSVRSLAELVGTSSTTVGNILTGTQPRVSAELANRLAVALGVPVADLFVSEVSASADANTEGA